MIVGRERYAAKVARTVRRGDAVLSEQSEARFLPYDIQPPFHPFLSGIGCTSLEGIMVVPNVKTV
jgi:hypothetical protein